MKLAKYDLQYLEMVPAIIGVDEAGRGPLAGPVCAAAVYIKAGFYQSAWMLEFGPVINDSKQLSESTREQIFEALPESSAGQIDWACHMSTVEEIETVNILGATRKAMAQCVDELRLRDSCSFDRAFEGEELISAPSRQELLFQDESSHRVVQILVDGKPLKPFPFSHTSIVKGDSKSLAIALASIIAKVTRDRYMQQQAEKFPQYGFVSNKGYGTPKHIAALKACGPCELHRMSFLTQILSSR